MQNPAERIREEVRYLSSLSLDSKRSRETRPRRWKLPGLAGVSSGARRRNRSR